MTLKKILDRFFSTSAAGLYLVLFAAAIGIATFIENDFGTSAAQKVVYRARWFEILLVLFGISVLVNIFRFRMIQQRKWGVFTFHAATLVILLGAAATRYFGSEGIMHIREGGQTNQILSNETFLQFEVQKNGQSYRFDEEVFFASLGKNKFKEEYQIGDEVYQIRLLDFIPNPVETVRNDEGGKSIIKVVMGGANGREEYLIKQGDKLNINGILFNFSGIESSGAINIKYVQDSLLFKADQPLTQMVMATQDKDTLPPGHYHPLLLRSLYSLASGNFVVSEFNPSAGTIVTSSSSKMGNNSLGMARLEILSGDHTAVLGPMGNKGMIGKPETAVLGKTMVKASYGAKYMQLPFSLRLKDFIMDRYPGTNSASSYASEVTLVDAQNNVQQDHRIYMNNILNYGGYRFFQSSFDQDEKGTVLSVNHDALGTWISYLGYFLLTLGMILTLFSKKSRFYSLSHKLKQIRVKRKSLGTAGILLLLLSSLPNLMIGRDVIIDPNSVVDPVHAEEFSTLVVQDHKGRMKPLYTLASEILRKVSRKTDMYDQTAAQIFLGMTLYPKQWADIPLIKISRHEKVGELLGIQDKWAAYNDFFTPEYILQDQVRRAYNLQPQERGTFEKELIKIDERVNIVNMVFSGRLMKIFPLKGDPGNTWISLADAQSHHQMASDFAHSFFPTYAAAVQARDWSQATQLKDDLCQYQQSHGMAVLPSSQKIKAEITLEKMNVFSRVGRYYGLFGLLTLLAFFLLVFNPSWDAKWPLRISLALLGICFLAHTAGLGLRWYVAGRAPWSNGYESMIYIAWTTMLAGLLFTRKSLGGLAATSILASTILMVAGLSWLDPEITPLVPVLRSYWLTIHVSLEAGSYGFLMLGAIIGVLNLILMIMANPRNRSRINDTIKEMTYISEMTLIGGLFMISVGTYLGGVWANESWGRYWGWDAKETWALVTILIYAFILHMRFIPGLRSLYAFNVATLFGLASVMMTYFGVNYYLSGLHSYAAGDPAPIPPFVFYSVGVLVLISLLAAWKNAHLNRQQVSMTAT